MLVLLNVWLIPIRYKRNIFGAMPMRRIVFCFHCYTDSMENLNPQRCVIAFSIAPIQYSLLFLNFCEPIRSHTYIDTQVRVYTEYMRIHDSHPPFYDIHSNVSRHT